MTGRGVGCSSAVGEGDHLDWIVDIPQEECVSKGQRGKRGGGHSDLYVCVCLFFFGLLSVSVYDCGRLTIVGQYFLPGGIVECEILSTTFMWEILQV